MHFSYVLLTFPCLFLLVASVDAAAINPHARDSLVKRQCSGHSYTLDEDELAKRTSQVECHSYTLDEDEVVKREPEPEPEPDPIPEPAEVAIVCIVNPCPGEDDL